MSLEIALTLGVLLFAVILFTTEIIRVDLVALIVLVTLVFQPCCCNNRSCICAVCRVSPNRCSGQAC